MQVAAYMLRERAFESNDFLRWGFLFQAILALSMWLFQLLSMQSYTTCFYKSAVLQQFCTFQAQVKDREGVYVKNVVHKKLLLQCVKRQ